MIVEDNPEFRDVIELALEDESNIRVTSQFGNAVTALRSLYSTDVADRPNLILLDLNLPGMSGIEALPSFRKEIPEAQVIILTQSDSKPDVLQAISEGASGYLLKSASLKEIIEGIHNVMTGGVTLDPSVTKFVISTLKQKIPNKKNLKEQLTVRELEVLLLLSEGLVKKEIAEKLNIGYSTVDTHVGNIYHKLGVRNAPAAVNQAFKLGLLEQGE